MARPRHQNGWITEHGKQLYGNFWRYVVDPVNGKRKRKQASVPLGEIGQAQKMGGKGEAQSRHCGATWLSADR
jgi:hypothetical protein